MLYRPNAHFPWSIHADTEINTIGSDASDGYARLTAHGMTPGDWCIGLRQNATGVATSGDALRGWKLYHFDIEYQTMLRSVFRHT